MRANEFLYEEADLGAIKQAIGHQVDGIFDIKELNKIYSYIRKVDLGKGFDQVFSKDEDLRQVQSILSNSIVKSSASFEEKMGFAQELATTGIINIQQLLTPGVVQNINDLVSTQYPNVFEEVAPDLMNIAGSFKSGDTKTQRGKGEFFLALCSTNIMISKNAGDLTINGTDIEVKANLARLKGRNGYGTTDAAYDAVKDRVAKFLAKLKTEEQHPEFTVQVGARGTLWSQFGPYCIQRNANPKDVVRFLRECLSSIVKSLYVKLDDGTLRHLVTYVGNNGVLNWNSFAYEMKYVAFSYYQNIDKFAGMILLNGTTLNCVYIDTAETFQQYVKVAKIGFDVGSQNGMQLSI